MNFASAAAAAEVATGSSEAATALVGTAGLGAVGAQEGAGDLEVAGSFAGGLGGGGGTLAGGLGGGGGGLAFATSPPAVLAHLRAGIDLCFTAASLGLAGVDAARSLAS